MVTNVSRIEFNSISLWACLSSCCWPLLKSPTSSSSSVLVVVNCAQLRYEIAGKVRWWRREDEYQAISNQLKVFWLATSIYWLVRSLVFSTGAGDFTLCGKFFVCSVSYYQRHSLVLLLLLLRTEDRTEQNHHHPRNLKIRPKSSKKNSLPWPTLPTRFRILNNKFLGNNWTCTEQKKRWCTAHTYLVVLLLLQSGNMQPHITVLILILLPRPFSATTTPRIHSPTRPSGSL